MKQLGGIPQTFTIIFSEKFFVDWKKKKTKKREIPNWSKVKVLNKNFFLKFLFYFTTKKRTSRIFSFARTIREKKSASLHYRHETVYTTVVFPQRTNERTNERIHINV